MYRHIMYKEWGSLRSPPPLLSGKGRQLTGIWDLPLSMRIYDILSQHIAKSINYPRNSLAPSPPLT